MIAPIAAPNTAPSRAKIAVTDESFQQTRPCTTCRRLEQLSLNLANRIVWGADVGDIALCDSIGGRRRVGSGFCSFAYRNDVISLASDLNFAAKLIDRHDWTDMRQRSERPDYFPQSPVGWPSRD